MLLPVTVFFQGFRLIEIRDMASAETRDVAIDWTIKVKIVDDFIVSACFGSALFIEVVVIELGEVCERNAIAFGNWVSDERIFTSQLSLAGFKSHTLAYVKVELLVIFTFKVDLVLKINIGTVELFKFCS